MERLDRTKKLIDAHCHLDWKSFTNDIGNVVKRAKENGLIAIITSCFFDGFENTLKIAEKYANYIFINLGLHPPMVNDNTVIETIKLIKENTDKIKAIGEVGLDYYWIKEPEKQAEQKKALITFINLSKVLKFPIVIHARNAHKDAIEILENNSAKDVLMHCFSGTAVETNRVIKNGWYISIPTSIVNRGVHQNIARICPMEKMLLETDSPFLSPFKKSRNEPMNVKYSVQKVADIKGIDEEMVAEMTTNNAIKFYNLEI